MKDPRIALVSVGGTLAKSPLGAILAAGLLGIGAVWVFAYGTSEYCAELRHASTEAEATRLALVRVSPGSCQGLEKSPPWLQLSGLLATPSVLLTWYWREKKRRDDQANKLVDQGHKDAEIKLAMEGARASLLSAIADRFAKGAELIGGSKAERSERVAGLRISATNALPLRPRPHEAT